MYVYVCDVMYSVMFYHKINNQNNFKCAETRLLLLANCACQTYITSYISNKEGEFNDELLFNDNDVKVNTVHTHCW